MGKLNVLLAKTDQLNAVIKKNLTDSIATFRGKQGHFKGEKTTYKERAAEYANPSNNVDKPVSSTVQEWFDYTFKHAGEFLKAKLDQEATNCSGTAKAKLVIEGKEFGELTTGELMALKGFFEQQALREMFEAAPTVSLTENWQPSDNVEYKRRGILEAPIQNWVDKATETTPKVEWDPLGKQPGIIVQLKSTVEKGDVSRQLFSGEISHIDRAEIMARLSKIVIAIKTALEEANHAEVTPSKVDPAALFTFLVKGQ